MKSSTQVITVEGSRYECGYQHGEQAKELVLQNIDYYFGWWNRNLRMSKKDVYDRADSVLMVSKEYDSGLVEEMRGLSDAVDVDFLSVVAMNGRYELAWASPAQLLGGCTSITALPRRSEMGNTLIAQNWDYRRDVSNSCIVLKVKVEDNPTVIMHTEAGLIGHKGLNSNGVGIVINAMVSDQDKLGESVPFFLVCRKMLDSPRFSEAVKALLNAKRSLSYNVMVAGEGVAVDLEAHPDDVSIIYPEDGVLAHTNHFVGDRGLSVKDNFVLNESNSVNRYVLAREMLANSKKHSFESFKEILTNHFDYPTSICHHPILTNSRDHQEETVSSVFMVPEKRLFMYTAGPPCSNEYNTVPF
jgi:isopenicillin-N N-acyltransferase like protein